MSDNYIAVNDDGQPTGFFGPAAIEVMRLRTILMGLHAEARGMRLTSRAPKCSTICRKQYGLKGSHAKLIPQVEKLLAEATAKVPIKVE